MTRPLPVLALLMMGAACGGRGEPAPGQPALETDAPTVTDSLVLTAPGGATVWFTEGRKDTGANGVTCVERTIEIRRDSTRQKIPLLYTLEAPTLLDDSTLKARLFRECAPQGSYRVSLKDAMPYRIPE